MIEKIIDIFFSPHKIESRICKDSMTYSGNDFSTDKIVQSTLYCLGDKNILIWPYCTLLFGKEKQELCPLII